MSYVLMVMLLAQITWLIFLQEQIWAQATPISKCTAEEVSREKNTGLLAASGCCAHAAARA